MGAVTVRCRNAAGEPMMISLDTETFAAMIAQALDELTTDEVDALVAAHRSRRAETEPTPRLRLVR